MCMLILAASTSFGCQINPFWHTMIYECMCIVFVIVQNLLRVDLQCT